MAGARADNRLMLNLDEWRENLLKEPAALSGGSSPIVQRHAEAAKDELVAVYPLGPVRKNHPPPGNLKKGVRVRKGATKDGKAATTLVSGAPHAHLYEFGTHVARPHPRFLPISQKHARLMQAELTAFVEAVNYRVTGAVD
jgi:hypothetical protein